MAMVYDPNKLNTAVDSAVGSAASKAADLGLSAGNVVRNLPGNIYTGVANMMTQPTGMRPAKPAFASPADVNAALVESISSAGAPAVESLRDLPKKMYGVAAPSPEAKAPTPVPTAPAPTLAPATTAATEAPAPQMSIYSTPGDTKSLTVGIPNATGGADTISSTDLAGMDRVYKGLAARGGVRGMTPSAAGGGAGSNDFWKNRGYESAADYSNQQKQAAKEAQINMLLQQSMMTPDPSTMTPGEVGATRARANAAREALKTMSSEAGLAGYRQAALEEQRQYHQGSLGLRAQELQDARAKAAQQAGLDEISSAKILQDIADKQRAGETEAGMAQYLTEYNRPSTLWEQLPFTETPRDKAQRLYGPYKATYEAAHSSLLKEGK